MTRTRVCMDNCAFESVIEAELQDGEKAMLRIKSDCASVQKLAEGLKEVSILQIWQTIEDSIIYRTASRYLKHPACLIPAAIVRTIEVEAGMALPGEASVSVERI